jgi:hypothetical protein
MYVVVAATEHPELDEWVCDQALQAATDNGLALGDYLGREDVLPEPQSPGICCHVFAAEPVVAQP